MFMLVGILSIPSVFGPVGAVPGSLIIIGTHFRYFSERILTWSAGWGLWNGWAAFIQAGFRNRHGGVHGVQDMAMIVGGKAYKELVGGLYLLGFVLVTGSGYIGKSVCAWLSLDTHNALAQPEVSLSTLYRNTAPVQSGSPLSHSFSVQYVDAPLSHVAVSSSSFFFQITAAFPKFSQISILCWLGVFSIYIAGR